MISKKLPRQGTQVKQGEDFAWQLHKTTLLTINEELCKFGVAVQLSFASTRD